MNGIETNEGVSKPRIETIKIRFILNSLFKSDEKTQSIPILMVTAKWQREYVMEAANAGTDSYIVKPFNLVELVDKIKEMLH